MKFIKYIFVFVALFGILTVVSDLVGDNAIRNAKRLQTQIDLKTTALILSSFYEKHNRWPENISELLIPQTELRGPLQTGLMKCFVPAQKLKGVPVIISVESQGTFAVMLNTLSIEERQGIPDLNAEGYRIIPSK